MLRSQSEIVRHNTGFRLKTRRLHALPVVDVNRGTLVGIVTAKDVMRDVMKIANKGLPAEDTSQSLSDLSGLAA